MTSESKKNWKSINYLENEIPVTALADMYKTKVGMGDDLLNSNMNSKTSNNEDDKLLADSDKNSKTSIDVKYVCRICLTPKNNMISLMSMVGQDMLLDIFLSVSCIKVHLDERLPLQICPSCHDNVINFHKFKLKCNKTNKILLSIIKGKCIINYKTEEESTFDKMDKTTQTLSEDDVEETETLHNDVENYIMGNDEIKMEIDMKTEISEEHEEIEYLEDDIYFENDDDDGGEKSRQEEGNDTDDELAKSIAMRKNYKAKKKQLQCNLCSKNFLKTKTLRMHMKQYHSNKKDKPFACGQCKESFTYEVDLHIHSALHDKGMKPHWTCNKCFKNFAERNRFRRHIRRHMQAARCACAACGKAFPEPSALRRHARVHTGERLEKKHRCDVCDKRFLDSSQLAAHSSRHTGVRPCACADCGKSFPSRRLLASHRLVHSDLKPFACDFCDKRFRHESTRNTHHRTHTGEKPFVCSICGKAFIQSSNLRLHMRSHTGERPYGCDICNRKFSSGSSLSAHRRTHTGEKPYSCDICNKKFARTDIRVHMRQHTGERPFACCVCSKKFTNATRLRDHCLTHTGEEPYECAICGEKFRKKGYLAKHIRNHNKYKAIRDKKIKEKYKPQVLIVQQVPFMVDNNLVYAPNTLNAKCNATVNDNEEANVDGEVENKDVTLVTEEVPLDVSEELVLEDDSIVKSELVGVHVGHSDPYEPNEMCLNTNNMIYDNNLNTNNANIVIVNEEVNVTESTSDGEDSEVKLYQLDQSLLQIQTSGRHITIRKVTSEMTTNY